MPPPTASGTPRSGAFYCTPKQNPDAATPTRSLQALQERRAHYLVATLMQPARSRPLHVFYYEFMYKNDLPGPCATDDSALYAPPAAGAPLEYPPRAAVTTSSLRVPAAAAARGAPGASVFYARRRLARVAGRLACHAPARDGVRNPTHLTA